MQVGDLVIGKGFGLHGHGVGMVIGHTEFGGVKVYWPKKGVWCLTGSKSVEVINEDR